MHLLGSHFGEFVDARLAGGQQRGDDAPAAVGQHPAVRAGNFLEQAVPAQQCEAAGDRGRLPAAFGRVGWRGQQAVAARSGCAAACAAATKIPTKWEGGERNMQQWEGGGTDRLRVVGDLTHSNKPWCAAGEIRRGRCPSPRFRFGRIAGQTGGNSATRHEV